MYAISFQELDFSPFNLLEIFGIGLFFDLGSLSYILSFFAAYLFLLPVNFTDPGSTGFSAIFFIPSPYFAWCLPLWQKSLFGKNTKGDLILSQ